MRPAYAKALGERLRDIRAQKGMSLHDVQVSSGGRWKAAVVGAYERGDRNVTVARLAQLADFYGVPLGELLPDGEVEAPAAHEARPRIVLDLQALDRAPEGARGPVARLAAAIQQRRGDFNGRVLTIREDDLMVLALLHELSVDEFRERLGEWGVLAEA
jgi:transcriptional regulator with XRE-family HTH domain